MAWNQTTLRSGNRKSRLDSVSRRMLFTWFILTGFILLYLPEQWTTKCQLTFSSMFRWPLRLGSGITLTSTTSQMLRANQLSRTEQINANTIANLQERLEEAYKKIDELSGLRSRYPLEGIGILNAGIIMPSIAGQKAELIINRGLNDGIESGFFVMADNCIIGTITNIDSRKAKVRLLTDESSYIPVKIGDSDVQRMMYGIGENKAKIEMVKTSVPISPGDEVFAYQQPGLLDTPMIIGIITSCKRDSAEPLIWDITVEPACDIRAIESVIVLIMNPKN